MPRSGPSDAAKLTYNPSELQNSARRLSMSRAVVTSLVFAAVFLCAGPAQSHHSNVEYEVTKVITVTGVVKEFEWVNPHTWLHITVDDGKGGKVVWLAE